MSVATERARGFTLLELMVAGAVGLIIVLAALAAFDLQSQFARNTERLLSAQASAGLGLTMMQRDLENAGLRFRGGVQNAGGPINALVVRPYDSLGPPINNLNNDPAGISTIVAASGSAPGFVPKTDAFEVLQGPPQASPQRLGAQVVSVAFAGKQANVTIYPNTFNPAELAAGGSSAPLMMFWMDDLHCMGRMVNLVSVAGTLVTITINTVDLDLGLSNTAFIPGCPAPLNNVEIFAERRRYLIYQTDGTVLGRPARTGLHVQRNAPCDPLGLLGPPVVCSTDLQAPAMVAEGIDDMQVAWRVPDADPVATNGWCQRGVADPTCGFEKNNSAWNAAITRRAASIYGVQIFLASRGQEVYSRPGEAPPQLLNRNPAPPVDNVVRAVMQSSVLFRNYMTP
jgi:prepilin-type N-terminal cleavage/methylation domain-containing protein